MSSSSRSRSRSRIFQHNTYNKLTQHTKQFLDGLRAHKRSELIQSIIDIYRAFEQYETDEITLLGISEIYIAVKDTFYPGLDQFISNSRKRYNIEFVDISARDSDTTKALLELSSYDDSDDNYVSYDFGINISLNCLNDLNGTKTLYSGGYTTKKRVIFIILMLLHEIIHIIEYSDPYLANAVYQHIVFFYITGFYIFGLVSSLSEIMDDDTYLNKQLWYIQTRIKDIEKIQKKNIIDDGTLLLNDHSHFDDGTISYLAYENLI